MADENRLRILKMLEKAPRCGCELQEVLGIVQSAVSRHLHILEGAGLVSHQRNGMWVDYLLVVPLADASAQAMLAAVLAALEDDPMCKDDRAKIAGVSREELCAAKRGSPERSRGE